MFPWGHKIHTIQGPSVSDAFQMLIFKNKFRINKSWQNHSGLGLSTPEINFTFFQVQTCPLFKSRPVLLKALDRFGHPLLRDAQLASFLVTSVDNNIFFGAAPSSVTKKKKQRNDDKTTLSIISIFTFLISQKCYNYLQQSVKSPIAKIQLLSCPFQDSEKRQEGG